MSDLIEILRVSCNGVLLGAATGSEELQVEATNRLLAAAREAAAALEAAREDAWQPIETCPSVSRVVMFCDERSNIWTDVAWDKSAACTGFTPTHWCELPAPPAIDQARGKGVAE